MSSARDSTLDAECYGFRQVGSDLGTRRCECTEGTLTIR